MKKYNGKRSRQRGRKVAGFFTAGFRVDRTEIIWLMAYGLMRDGLGKTQSEKKDNGSWLKGINKLESWVGNIKCNLEL